MPGPSEDKPPRLTTAFDGFTLQAVPASLSGEIVLIDLPLGACSLKCSVILPLGACSLKSAAILPPGACALKSAAILPHPFSAIGDWQAHPASAGL
jgi:hypothetical protein